MKVAKLSRRCETGNMILPSVRLVRGIFLSLFVLLVVRVEAAYGLKWTPGDDTAVAGAYLTPENAFEMRMRQPDGKIRRFRRDFSSPSLLYGDAPWVGEDMGNGTFRIVTHPDFKGGRTAYVFVNGHLRRMVLGRKDYKFDQMHYPAENVALESLWPKELTEEEMRSQFNSWKHDDGRLRIGYKNPNKGGCLMAEIVLVALALFGFAVKRRKWLGAIAAIVAVAAFVGLVMTQSRSAFIALVIGVAALLALKVKALFTWRNAAVASAVLVIAALFVAFSGAGARFTTGLVNSADPSDALRVNILKAAPRMMVDAPGGWGLGLSGAAYANWYQAPDEVRVVRTLVNSHLTWLVELGWCGRVAYLGGICALLFMLFMAAKRGASSLPFALFISFFIAGLFNSVMESPTLWALPCASLLLLLTTPGRKSVSCRMAGASLAGGLLLGMAVLAVFVSVGVRGRLGPSLRADGERVIVNGKDADAWVVDDNVVLGQGFLGRELRMFYAAFPENPPMGVTWSLADVPASAKSLAVAGKRCEDFVKLFAEDPAIARRFEKIMFISPPFPASSVPAALAAMPGFEMVQGELAARLTPDAANPPPFLTIIPGAELYIPGWMNRVAPNGISM